MLAVLFLTHKPIGWREVRMWEATDSIAQHAHGQQRRQQRLRWLLWLAVWVAASLLGVSLRAETLPPLPEHLQRTPVNATLTNSFGTNDSAAVRSLTVGQLQALAARKLNRDVITRLLGPLPAWLQRTEINGNFDLGGWRGLEITSVQPLWQAADQHSALFTQFGGVNYRMFDRQRFAGNIGLGYRQLVHAQKLMLGGNVFYDYEFVRGHQRLGIGAEAKTGPLDFTVNGYLGLNQRVGADGTVERVPNGLDIELGSQVPYLPWLKLYGKYYLWDHKLDTQPVRGAQLAVNATLHRALTVESGVRHDLGGRSEGFFMLRVTLNSSTLPGLLDGAPLVADTAFTPRDLSQTLLGKVRRENRILLERSNPVQGRRGLSVSVSRAS
jgi:hypothetical protein